jgi:hypothetical protein
MMRLLKAGLNLPPWTTRSLFGASGLLPLRNRGAVAENSFAFAGATVFRLAGAHRTRLPYRLLDGFRRRWSPGAVGGHRVKLRRGADTAWRELLFGRAFPPGSRWKIDRALADFPGACCTDGPKLASNFVAKTTRRNTREILAS